MNHGFIDAHSVVIFTGLMLSHLIGVIVVASAAAPMAALFVVVLAVRVYRTTSALIRYLRQ